MHDGHTLDGPMDPGLSTIHQTAAFPTLLRPCGAVDGASVKITRCSEFCQDDYTE